jgi:hypothetical protein
MDQATEFVQQNKGWLGTVAFLAVILAILFVVYQYLYPADDPTYTSFMKTEHDGRKPFVGKKKVPAIYTGGDFTLSFWIYIDDFNYRSSSYKHLFSIQPQTATPNSIAPIVGVLTPLQNNLMVRANTVSGAGSAPAPGVVSSTAAGPDITVLQNLTQLLQGQTSASMFQSTVEAPCDVKEVPLQRWVCVSIVSSGRILDVYMDGKLARSCVLDSVVNVPRQPLELRMCDAGGIGGRISSVQMWSAQLTPDVIYGIYMMGPSQVQHNIFTDVAKWLNLNVSFTGSTPGEATQTQAPTNPFQGMYNTGAQGVQGMSSDAGALWQRI